MDSRQKRRWTYVIIAVAVAIIMILAVILMQRPIPTSTTPQVKTPPSVSTGAATGVGKTSATLNGQLASLGTAASVTVGFLWGTSPSLAGATNVSAGAKTVTVAFGEDLTGLTAGTTYYFKAWAGGDGFASAAILSFTTPAEPAPQVHAPSVATNAPSSIERTNATLNGNLDSLGTASTVTVGFLYDTNPDLTGAMNVSLGSKAATGAFDQPVAGLSPNTTYYVQAWAVGDGFASGSVLSFTTTAAPGGDGNHVPPGWSHAHCPDLPAHAVAHGVRARCEHNMTWGEMKKEGLAGVARTVVPNFWLHESQVNAALRASDGGHPSGQRPDTSRQ